MPKNLRSPGGEGGDNRKKGALGNVLSCEMNAIVAVQVKRERIKMRELKPYSSPGNHTKIW